jgi:hypothetical protein
VMSSSAFRLTPTAPPKSSGPSTEPRWAAKGRCLPRDR